MKLELIVVEFERVTKWPLMDFLARYRDFMINSYPEINRYFSGETESIDNFHLTELSYLANKTKDLLTQFKNFANKFSTCGYWELMEYVGELSAAIEKINKLPKFRRTSLTRRGYQPVIQASGSVGSFRTMEDVANSIKRVNGDNTNWVDLMLGNDMNEGDWEIDELKPITALVNNRIDIVVTTILDQPIGVRIYGRDIKRKITFKDNDLELVEYQKNVEQKCDILLKLSRGDVPEDMMFGINSSLFRGVAAKSFAYPELVQQISQNFLQNNLFEYAVVRDMTWEDGSLHVIVDIKTKYDYKTEKSITI